MNDTGLAPEDVITIVGFLAIVIVALIWEAIRNSRDNSPRAKIRRRVLEMTESSRPVETLEDIASKTSAVTTPNRLEVFVRDLMDKLIRKGGPFGPLLLVASAILLSLVPVAAVISLDLSFWLLPPMVLLAAFAGGSACHAVITNRFKQRFLQQFPEALDLIIRAVSAGVPVIQAIQMAGEEMSAPLGREFARIGNALRLGMEQQDVMEAAAQHIDIPDFRFFVVCLQLQRETGGPLAETLENLAGVIRVRRDTRLKTRALTAQGRAASKAISVIPLAMVGMMQANGSNYLEIMYSTPQRSTVALDRRNAGGARVGDHQLHDADGGLSHGTAGSLPPWRCRHRGGGSGGLGGFSPCRKPVRAGCPAGQGRGRTICSPRRRRERR